MSRAPFDIIVSDLHHRISGVSATVHAILPHLAKRAACAFVAKREIAGIKPTSLWQLWRATALAPLSQPFFIWHVRRNNEMTWALIFKYIFRRNIKIVFTSAAIRRHSWWPRWLISKMDCIIATSEKAAQFMPHVAAVIPHGVDIQRFTGEQCQPHFDAQFNQANRYVGIVGRVRPEKGVDLFVEVMLQVLVTQPNTKAVIIGKTTAKYLQFKKELQAKIAQQQQNDAFIWLDEVPYDDMPSLYSQLDIVLCPARYEGFGLVPLEAGASGCAVIATNTGAYRDIIIENQTGFVVDIGDQSAMSRHLDALLSDAEKLQLMQKSAQHHVQSNHSLINEISGIIAVYQSI